MSNGTKWVNQIIYIYIYMRSVFKLILHVLLESQTFMLLLVGAADYFRLHFLTV